MQTQNQNTNQRKNYPTDLTNREKADHLFDLPFLLKKFLSHCPVI